MPTLTQTLVVDIANLLSYLAPPDLIPFSPPLAHVSPLRIICISDTHNAQPSLPPGDVLIHAGDLSDSGTFDEIQAQLDWLNEQPHRYKVVVAGNHDTLLDESYHRISKNKSIRDMKKGMEEKGKQDLNWGSVVYLQGTSTTLTFPSRNNRTVNIFGAPWVPNCGYGAFQYSSSPSEALSSSSSSNKTLDAARRPQRV